MRKIIKEDILNVIEKAINALERNDHLELRKLSNHTIHDASVFQEDDPLTLAIVMYALAKVIQRCAEEGKACPRVIPQLKVALESLKANDDNAYRATIKKLLRTIVARDEQVKVYTQAVVEKAKIKKGRKLHEHGISVARVAEILGLSQWELRKYIGKFAGDGRTNVKVAKRLRHARRLFE